MYAPQVDHLFPIMNKFRMQLEECQRVLEDRRPSGTGNPNASNVAILRVLQCTSQEMNNLVFVLRPLASAVMALTEYARYNGLTELQWYFDDLRDHVSTILDYVASMQVYVVGRVILLAFTAKTKDATTLPQKRKIKRTDDLF